MIDSRDCCYHFLLVEGLKRQHSLVANIQYCAVLLSRGGWYQVTVYPSSSPSNPLQPIVDQMARGANVL